MKKVTSLSERHKIEEMVNQGYSSGAIAEELGYSVSTIKKWRKRTSQGIYHSQMGRPPCGALSSFPPLVSHDIDTMKSKESGWGPLRILVELNSKEPNEYDQLPSRSSIARYLKAQGKVRSYQPHGGVPATPLHPVEAPHDLWQMDAKGTHHIEGVGYIALINIKETFAGVYPMSFPAIVNNKCSQANTRDYQQALRFAFTEFGLPKQIQVDHDSIFFDNVSPSPFPTLLHLWLISLGIDLCYSRIHQPTDQAQVERSHQTLTAHAIGKKSFFNWDHLFDHLQKERQILNETFPSQSRNNKAPLDACPEARHSGREYYPQSENQLSDLDRIYQFLQKGKWFRKFSKSKTLSLGGQKYYLSLGKPMEQIRIQFDPHSKHLLFYDDKELLVDSLPIRGIDKPTLLGHLSPEILLSGLQLTIPIYPKFQKHNQQSRLLETMGSRLSET